MGMTIEDLDDLKAYLNGIRDDLETALERLEMIEEVVERIDNGNDN